MSTPSISSPLLSGLGEATAPKKPGKVHEAAQQFEALMIGEMMKTARESGSEEGWLGGGGGTGDDQATAMAESQFSQALASHGGFGLAKMIEQTINRQHGSAPKENAPTHTPPVGSR
jgi:Rod binding domain-containing protein